MEIQTHKTNGQFSVDEMAEERLRNVRERLRAVGHNWRPHRGRRSQEEQDFLDHAARDLDYVLGLLRAAKAHAEKPAPPVDREAICPSCYYRFLA